MTERDNDDKKLGLTFEEKQAHRVICMRMFRLSRKQAELLRVLMVTPIDSLPPSLKEDIERKYGPSFIYADIPGIIAGWITGREAKDD